MIGFRDEQTTQIRTDHILSAISNHTPVSINLLNVSHIHSLFPYRTHWLKTMQRIGKAWYVK
ncbi:hypothetical protein T4E_618 [Trichinella pseudospiralis]|uniref:Uncharacterized protein n=1 Tax=Trichinella pseudospiralis TaxID=6337 RepID=A0A0V0WII4_TRIPS|nr:hypothetical protein T4E_618 [Trichinella pseudospiralis]